MLIKLHTNCFVLPKIHTSSFACNKVHKFTHKAFYYIIRKIGDSMTYQPSKPKKISDIQINFTDLITLIGKSHSALSNYNGALSHLINPQILLAPMTTKESTMSSKIEGTQATFTEVLQHDAGENFDTYKRQEIQEVLNYRSAMSYATELLKERPFIHLNMVRDIHKVLLSGVRGENKARGEFRKIQNWIGPKNSTIETASFVPPAPNEIIDYLDEWEKFINSDFDDLLIQLAIVHAQFEIIHPFSDGNGRLGRLLIPIFLYSKEYLSQPIFYLSEYFESHREEYYSNLRNITAENNWQDWIKFFLTAIIEQSKINTSKINQILELADKMKNIILETTKSQYTSAIIDSIFAKPIFTTTTFLQSTNISNRKTAISILQKLVEKKVIQLVRESSGNRSNLYAFKDLMDIIES